MYLIEDDSFLKKEHIDYIENFILKTNFPFYYQNESAVDNNEEEMLTHTVLRRPELRKENETINSGSYDFFVDILNTFCKKQKIKINEILRINVNLTFNNGIKKCPTHLDHSFPHKQLLVYLNEIKDKKSYTVLINKNKKIKIKPVKYKGICFDSIPHYHYFPRFGSRIVAIFTFR